VWNDTSELEEEAMLDEMQAQWLVEVAEGCAHARVGLALLGAFGGRLSTDILVGILGYVFGGNDAHLMSCVSTERIATVGPVALLMTAPASEVQTAKGAGAGGSHAPAGEPRDTSMQVQQQPGPRVALVSHALALGATRMTECRYSGRFDPDGDLTSPWWIAKLIAVSEPENEGGCKWLHGYCRFMEQRHRLNPTRTPIPTSGE
jgi:hypothetical protein